MSRRFRGGAFDRVADDYDRHRPAYPDELVDQACELGSLGPGDEVLEVGCGTGQLTRALLSRGLRVTAVEPGERLLALARRSLDGAGDVEFVNSRLEDARLPRERFAAVFSASAIHWVDPDIGWQRIADALAPDGTLALIQYFGLDDPYSAADQRALLRAVERVAPETAAGWPVYRDLDTTLAGVLERRTNISEAWAWLGGHDLGRSYVAALFDDAEMETTALPFEHTAQEINALIGTMSFWSQLSPARRAALEDENRALHDRLGRPIRSSTLACLATARRALPQ
ncbi:MAG TPA: class I SAM-dependent methyltransferase [Solirubrobacteraceae bacterium]|nr:class I SAM-dependent methyltransferase [Solirubrobacteraceae bacterium]